MAAVKNSGCVFHKYSEDEAYQHFLRGRLCRKGLPLLDFWARQPQIVPDKEFIQQLKRAFHIPLFSAHMNVSHRRPQARRSR